MGPSLIAHPNNGCHPGDGREVRAQTLTLFKTEICDFPSMLKTACSFLRPGLNTSSQKSLSSFVVAQASVISANK